MHAKWHRSAKLPYNGSRYDVWVGLEIQVQVAKIPTDLSCHVSISISHYVIDHNPPALHTKEQTDVSS